MVLEHRQQSKVWKARALMNIELRLTSRVDQVSRAFGHSIVS